MDIHKPKPWHGLREFLKEYGIIVLGVLTALGLEQAVEAAHRAAEVREAREALHEEIRADSHTLVAGMEEDKCLLAQLGAYDAWASRGPKPPAFRTMLPEYRTSSWDTVKTSAVPHMPLAERLAIAEFYDLLYNEQKVVDIQRANALVLFGAHERKVLDPSDAGRVLDAVAVERQLTNFHISNGKVLLAMAADMGVRPPPLTPEARAALARLCGQGGAANPGPG